MFPSISLQFEDPMSLIMMILPLIICCLMPSIMRSMQKPAAAGGTVETDTWFTSAPVEEVYEAIRREVEVWKEETQIQPTKKGKGGRVEERFRVEQEIPPRLYRVVDRREGEITFELTDVERGGTSIRSTYNPAAKPRVQAFRAKTPAKVPARTEMNCPSCGRPVMPDFASCPYCGTKL